MFAEWINYNYLLNATTEWSSHLKDLEKKLLIWLGKGQAARQPREAWVTSSAQVLPAKIYFICNGVQSVPSSPLHGLPSLSSHEVGQSVDCLGFRAALGQWKEQEGLGSSSCFITVNNNFSLQNGIIILLPIS